ncbi:hypothetical protein LXL04_026127 [Taraxacum kok-saghyz]
MVFKRGSSQNKVDLLAVDLMDHKAEPTPSNYTRLIENMAPTFRHHYNLGLAAQPLDSKGYIHSPPGTEPEILVRVFILD